MATTKRISEKATLEVTPNSTKAINQVESRSAEIKHKIGIEAHKRLINRQHLFSGRLATLLKTSTGRPIPLFEHTSRLFNMTIRFGNFSGILKFSRLDNWTDAYVKKLRQFSSPMDSKQMMHQYFGYDVAGAIFSLFSRSAGGFMKLFKQSTVTNLISIAGSLAIVSATSDNFIRMTALGIILANIHTSIDILTTLCFPIGSTFFHQGEKTFSWIPACVGMLGLFCVGTCKADVTKNILGKSLNLGWSIPAVLGTVRITEMAVRELIPAIYELVTGKTWLADTVMSNLNEFQLFVERMDAFDRSDFDLNTNFWNQRTVIELKRQYTQLLIDADKMKLRAAAQPLLIGYGRKLEKWMEKIHASGLQTSGARIEPVVVLISGKPAIGKSRFVNELVKEAGVNIPWQGRPGENIMDHIYTRNPNDAFWATYRQQYAVLYDDFLQRVDSSQNPNPEIGELIQLYSTNAFMVPMAALEDKQKGFFRSPLVILTTNTDQLDSTVVKSVNSVAAVRRRMDFSFRMCRDATGKEIFYPIIEGRIDLHLPLTRTQVVNAVRAKLAMKKEWFEQEMQKPNRCEIPIRCVSEMIEVVSAPAYCEDTGVKREKRIAEPNHTYCHPSAACRVPNDQTDVLINPIPIQQFDGRITNDLVPEEVETEPNLTQEPVLMEHQAFFENILNYANPPPQATIDMQIPYIVLLQHNYMVENDYLEEIDEIIGRFNVDHDDPPVRRPLTNSQVITLVDFEPRLAHYTGLISINDIEAERELLEDRITHAISLGYQTPDGCLKRWYKVVCDALIKTYERFGGIFKDIPWRTIGTTLGVVATVSLLATFFWKLAKCIMTGATPFTDHENTIDNMNAIYMLYKLESRDSHGRAVSRRATTIRMNREGVKPVRAFELTEEKIDLEGSELDNSTVSFWLPPGKLIGKPSLRPELLVSIRSVINFYKRSLNEINSKIPAREVIDVLAYVMDKMLDQGILMEDIIEAFDLGIVTVTHLENIHGPHITPAVILDLATIIFADRKPMSLEGFIDSNAEGISQKIQRNLVDISCDGKRLAQALFFRDRTCWINTHVWNETYGRKLEITYFNGPERRTITVPQEDIKSVTHDKHDITILTFPISMKPFANIENHIVTDADLKVDIIRYARVVTRRQEVITYLSTSMVERETRKIQTADGFFYDAHTAWFCPNINSASGDCGSPLIILDPTMPRKICGMHFLGNEDGNGGSLIVTRELIADMLDEPVPQGAQVHLGTYESMTHSDVPPCDFVNEPLVTFPPPFEPTKTKIKPSLLQGEIAPPITAPAVLRPFRTEEGTLMDPLERGVRGFNQHRPYIEGSFLKEIPKLMYHYTKGIPVICRKLTWTECGTAENIAGLEPIDLSTSPGWPLCQIAKGGKRDFFTPEKQPLPKLISMCEDFERQLENGTVTDVPIFRDTLKDERVALRKCNRAEPKTVKTRVFAASPLVLLMLSRKYYGAMCAHLINNRIRNTTTSGVNPFSDEWHMITTHLHSVSPEVDDGDYSGFDSTQPAGFLFAVYQSWIDWYEENDPNWTPTDSTIRLRLADLCVNAHHMAHGTIYRTYGSLPSGVFGTTHLNSGVNLIAFYYAFTKVYPETSVGAFMKKVRMATHGDDVIFAVDPDLDDFTAERIGHELRTIGMEFGPATKDGVFQSARPIEKCTFLKRGFTKINQKYRAPLDTRVCIEMTNWITKSNDPVSATIDNVETSIRELVLAGEEKLANDMARLVRQRFNLIVDVPTQPQLLSTF